MIDKLTIINDKISKIEWQLDILYAIKILTDDNILELKSEINDLEFNKKKHKNLI